MRLFFGASNKQRVLVLETHGHYLEYVNAIYPSGASCDCKSANAAGEVVFRE